MPENHIFYFWLSGHLTNLLQPGAHWEKTQREGRGKSPAGLPWLLAYCPSSIGGILKIRDVIGLKVTASQVTQSLARTRSGKFSVSFLKATLGIILGQKVSAPKSSHWLFGQ